MRKLESFDNIIYLEDYIWVMKIRPKDKRQHYGHALMTYYWQKEQLNKDIKHAEALEKVAQVLEDLEHQKKKKETSNNPGNTPTAG